MYIDTHCHVFSEYYDDIEKVISECKDNNVNRIIVNGCDIVSNKEVLELVNKYDIIYGAIGFHPTELDDFNDEYFSFLEENINNSKIVAVGEIGLDYHYDNTDREKQIMVFRKQLDIAQKLFNDKEVSEKVTTLDASIRTDNEGPSLGMENSYQSLGSVARPSVDDDGTAKQIAVYMGTSDPNTKVDIVFLQNYGQPGE